MEKLSKWLEAKYLEWQMDHGRISLAKWSKVLGVDNTYLNQMMNGKREGTSMQTAYQIGSRLDDFSILKVLGYPVPDVSLTGFTNEQRESILDFLGKVKVTLEGLSPDEQDAKLNEMLDGLPEAETDTE